MRSLAATLAIGMLLLSRLAGAADPVELLPLPAPNLTDVEPAIADQLVAQRQAVEALLAEPQAESDLPAALGELGRLYLAYGLNAAAETCFTNARLLAPGDYRWSYYLGVIAQGYQRNDDARSFFEEVVARKPDDLPTLIRLGDVELANNRLDEASAWYQRALALLPVSPAAHFGLGQIAVSRGDSAAAVEQFSKVLEAQPEATAVHYPLGLAYRDLGDLDKAREHLAQQGEQKVVRYDPLLDELGAKVTGAALFLRQGNSAMIQGDLPRAIEAYRRAVAEAPDDPTARRVLASALARAGQTDEALSAFEALEREAPDDAIVRYNLATLYSGLGRSDKALEHFAEAVRLSPDFLDARFNYATTLENLGRAEEAAAQFREILKRQPEDRQAKVRLASVLVDLDRAEEAERLLDELLATDPSDSLALLTRATALRHLGRDEEAKAILLNLANGDGDTQIRARAWFALGEQELAAGRAEDAAEAFRQVTNLAPGVAVAHGRLATALARTGRYDEAAVEFSKVLSHDPKNAEAHLGHSLALLLAGHDRLAGDSLGQALDQLPGEPVLLHLLARLLAASDDSDVRDGERALELARRVFEQEPTVEHGATVAMALAELGRFDEAADLQTRVIAEAERQGAEPLLPRLRAELDTYRNGLPVRAPWLSQPATPGRRPEIDVPGR